MANLTDAATAAEPTVPVTSPSETTLGITAADLTDPNLRVADVMTAHPQTCSPFSSIVEASLVFRSADCGVIPVTEDGRPVGVLTDRDIALALGDHNGDLSRVTVGELMTKNPITVEDQTTLSLALSKLADEAVRRLLVVDANGQLRGVLSWADLVNHVGERALGRVVARIIAGR
jgi:CBS domain-containing protein